jgi:hypothetical protein
MVYFGVGLFGGGEGCDGEDIWQLAGGLWPLTVGNNI